MTYFQPEIFSDLGSVEVFDASRNTLSFLADNQFEKMLSLADLRIHSNVIEKISVSSFHGAKELVSVDLSHNRLASDAFLAGLGPVKSLNLSFNRYKRIDPSLLKDIESAELVGNFWQCDWLIPAIVHRRLPPGMHFVPLALRNLAYDEIDCYIREDDSSRRHHLRHIVVLRTNRSDCEEQRQVWSPLTSFRSKISR